MMPTYRHPLWGKTLAISRLLLAALILLTLISPHVSATPETPPHSIQRRSGSPERPILHGPPSKRADSRPLRITNRCAETIWPGIASQAGTGPGTGGFVLTPGNSTTVFVGADWQGRVWGRTNCSFNEAGTRASNLNGVNGGGRACMSGDCAGVLSCALTGDTPVTLAEFDLIGGVDNTQTFYDISLVDGYNLPMQIVYIPGNSTALQQIPPNLTNCACIATSGFLDPPSASGTSGNSSNSSYPIPYESIQTDATVSNWCPWDLQVTPPTKPGDGIYPYPDDSIKRPIFGPCLSACAKTNSPSDCCSGAFNSPTKCSPNLYARRAKAVCPDAYSFAYDDQTSTFIVPTGGGWEVVFCPAGRSTNIIRTFKPQLEALSQMKGTVSRALKEECQNLTIIESGGKLRSAAVRRGQGSAWRGVHVWVMLSGFLVWDVMW